MEPGTAKKEGTTHIVARLDILFATRCRQLLAQLAESDVDHLGTGLVHSTMQVGQEHLLGQSGPLRGRSSSEICYSLPV